MLKPVLTNPWVQAVGVLLAILLVVFLVYLLTPVLVPLCLAFLVAYVLDPVVDMLERRGIRRGIAIAALAFLGLILLLAIPVFVIPNVVGQADELIRSANETGGDGYLSRMTGSLMDRLPLDDIAKELGWVEADAEDIDARAVMAEGIGTLVRENALQLVRRYAPQLATAGQWAGSTAAHILFSIGQGTLSFFFFMGNLVLFAFVTGYLLYDFDRLIAGIRALIPPRIRSRTTGIVARIDGQVHSFLRGQMLVCLCLGIMYGAGMLMSGVPFAVPLAVFGGVASFVPYLGVALTIGPAFVLTLLQHGVDWHAAGVLVTFAVAQSIEGSIITPKIVGDKVGLNPVWVILAIIVFSNAMGFLGLLLAVPIAASLKVLVVEAVDYYRRSPLFADGPPDEDAPAEEDSPPDG